MHNFKDVLGDIERSYSDRLLGKSRRTIIVYDESLYRWNPRIEMHCKDVTNHIQGEELMRNSYEFIGDIN